MKKLILVLVASFFIFQVSDAQMFKYGIKAGVGFSSLKIEDVTGITGTQGAYDLITGDGVMGYHIGIQTQIKVAMIVIKPEVYFNAGGGTVEQVAASGVTEILNVNFSRIDVPVLVGAKFGPARINVGPVGSYVLSEENGLTTLGGEFTDYSFFTKSMTWGFQAGLGVDLMNKISLDARYEGSLSKLGETLSISGNEFALDGRPSQWVISLGVWF